LHKVWLKSGAAGGDLYLNGTPLTRPLLDALSEFSAQVCVRTTDFHTKLDLIARISDKIRWHAFLRASYGNLSNLSQIFQILPVEYQTISMCANMFSFAEPERALSGVYTDAIELFPETDWRISYQFIHGIMHLMVCHKFGLTPIIKNIKIADCDNLTYYSENIQPQECIITQQYASILTQIYYSALESNSKLLVNYLKFVCATGCSIAVIPNNCMYHYKQLQPNLFEPVSGLKIQLK
jgi:hypothetical protein